MIGTGFTKSESYTNASARVISGRPRKQTALIPVVAGEYAITGYDVETLCSLSTLFLTVGRCIMRSCHAV